jgi:EAL domain-containing protein (putative c-di-GMP-specific phosphodiesterase class I)
MQTLPAIEVASPLAWLETMPREGQEPRRADLRGASFTIGRNDACDFPIESSRVSREHVRIELTADGYVARDLESTNGTYINGVKIKEAPLADGDILTVANIGLIFHLPKEAHGPNTTHRFTSHEDEPAETAEPSANDLIDLVRFWQEMALQRALEIHAQPIVQIDHRQAIAYELRCGPFAEEPPRLNICKHALPDCRAAWRLHDLFRTMAVERASSSKIEGPLFLPITKNEWAGPELLESLEQLSRRFSEETRLIVQVAEEIIDDTNYYADVQHQLADLGIGIALDSFSGSPAALGAIRNAPPEFLKIEASALPTDNQLGARPDTFRLAVKTAQEFGSQLIGCGVRSQQQWQACKAWNLSLAQGEWLVAATPLEAVMIGRGTAREAARGIQRVEA